MKRGIVLLAIGDSIYGQWAWNFVVSINKYSPNLPVQLIYSPSAIKHLSDWQLSFFDVMTKIKEEDCYENKVKLAPCKAKLSLYDYAAFKENIYLDVDGIVINDLNTLFDKFSDRDYTIENQAFGTKGMGEFKQMLWGSPEDVWEHFKLKSDAKLPATNSSFQYFKKSRKASKIFKDAKKLYMTNPFPTAKQIYKWGKNNQPDELYLNVVLAKLKDNEDCFAKQSPIFFCMKQNGFAGEQKLKEKYHVLGYYGEKAILSINSLEYYDRAIRIYLKPLGIHPPFKIHKLLEKKFLKTN